MPDERLIAFGKELRRRRNARGITLVQFGEATGVTPNYIATIEHGHRDPGILTVLRLADALGATLDELFGRASVSPMLIDQARSLRMVPPVIRAPMLKAMLELAGEWRKR